MNDRKEIHPILRFALPGSESDSFSCSPTWLRLDLGTFSLRPIMAQTAIATEIAVASKGARKSGREREGLARNDRLAAHCMRYEFWGFRALLTQPSVRQEKLAKDKRCESSTK